MNILLQTGWSLVLALTVCSCSSTRPESGPQLPYRHGSKEFVWVARFSEFDNPQSDTGEIISKILTREGIKGGMESLSAGCELYVHLKDRLKVIELLESSPELRGHRLQIFTDAEIARMNEPKEVIFRMAKNDTPVWQNLLKIKEVFKDSGIRWQQKVEEGRILVSVPISQKSTALRLVKNNAVLKGLDVQFAE